MADRILVILNQLRRRMLATRMVEGAAVAGAAGGLVAALLMAGRIVWGQLPLLSLVLVALPLLAGLALALWPRLRELVSPLRPLGWAVVALCLAGGIAGLAAWCTGRLAVLPKDPLILILPGSAVLGAILALIWAPSLRQVAIGTDERAALQARLATAWELTQSDPGAPGLFAQAVRQQALSAATGPEVRKLRFWTRTRATAGALGLAVAASLLMLTWEPLESAEAVARRHWQELAPPAGENLAQQVEALQKALAGGGELATALKRLEKVAAELRQARPQDARQWQGKVIELNKLAQAIRQAVAEGKVDPALAGQLDRLLRTIEQTASDLAEGMGGQEGANFARTGHNAINPDLTNVATAPAGHEGAVAVWDPDLKEVATQAAPATGTVESLARTVPFDRAWAQAQQRAMQSLSAGQVPARCQQLVRDFFAK